jgi:sec-independent protein translocase protein TatA
MFNGGVGVTELLLVLGIILLIFGPKRLPGIGRQLGRGMREFKDSITGDSRDEDDDLGLGGGDGRSLKSSPSRTETETPARDTEQPRT